MPQQSEDGVALVAAAALRTATPQPLPRAVVAAAEPLRRRAAIMDGMGDPRAKEGKPGRKREKRIQCVRIDCDL